MKEMRVMNRNEFKTFIEGDSLIVLDTNVLLALYKYSSYSSLNIVKVLNSCIDKLWIPNQVHKEFERNKNSEISKIKKKYKTFEKDLINEVVKASEKIISRINESKKLQYPNCNVLEKRLEKHITDLISEIEKYKEELGVEYKLSVGEEKVQEISAFVDVLVNNGKVGQEVTYSEIIEIIKEGELRYKYKLPPGYEDAKTKEGIDIYGDLFIWKEIVNLPKVHNVSSVIFVTNDMKEDWWILSSSQKKPAKIRNELKKEFKEINNNVDITLITLSEFHEIASKYYNLPSFHTELELNAEYYCRHKVVPKFERQLWDILYGYAVEQDVTDFSDEFYKCNDNEVMGDDIKVEVCSFRIEEDNAIYSIILNLPIVMYLSYEDDEGDSFQMGEVNYTIFANIDFIQGINVEENKLNDNIEFEILGMEIVDLSVIDPYDLYSDEDAYAEMCDTLEEYHKH